MVQVALVALQQLGRAGLGAGLPPGHAQDDADGARCAPWWLRPADAAASRPRRRFPARRRRCDPREPGQEPPAGAEASESPSSCSLEVPASSTSVSRSSSSGSGDHGLLEVFTALPLDFIPPASSWGDVGQYQAALDQLVSVRTPLFGSRGAEGLWTGVLRPPSLVATSPGGGRSHASGGRSHICGRRSQIDDDLVAEGHMSHCPLGTSGCLWTVRTCPVRVSVPRQVLLTLAFLRSVRGENSAPRGVKVLIQSPSPALPGPVIKSLRQQGAEVSVQNHGEDGVLGPRDHRCCLLLIHLYSSSCVGLSLSQASSLSHSTPKPAPPRPAPPRPAPGALLRRRRDSGRSRKHSRGRGTAAREEGDAGDGLPLPDQEEEEEDEEEDRLWAQQGAIMAASSAGVT
ncbi:LOW QUALITY PROTEIN: hypothetical protein CRUP_001188 [Coryphaenoides rupestris]|nr:LOW QUALITY PROTEIN: hypothetical protein CRUP_001188 [Coryphaenoides rupestris]